MRVRVDDSMRTVLTKTHAMTIIMAVGDAATKKGTARRGDVLQASESGSRTKSVRLQEMICAGYVEDVKEYAHPHNVKHLNLTPRGWKIYYAVRDDEK